MPADAIQIQYNDELKPLEKVLAQVRRSGEFVASGALAIPLPKLEVNGVGVISFPVPESQMAALIQRAVRAPYGRGQETILDTSVRKVWQVAPDQVRLGGKTWAASFETILARVTASLGCGEAAVSAELYKLLVYETGGFFLAHRDTEKSEGMFGTLVLVLPSVHRGGELIVRHAGRAVTVDLSGAETSEISFVAFYADCEHEVRPITEGNRVCLVYNLLLKRAGDGKAAGLTAPHYESQIEKAATLLQEALGRDGATVKIAWLLEHQYTPAGLSFAALKSSDAAKAKVLVEAAHRAGCAAHLGLVHIEESGQAESDYGYSGHRSRRYRSEPETGGDDDQFEVVEVYDSSRHVDHWLDPEDRPVEFGELPLEDGELLPAGALDGEKPDVQRFMEASGNEGASFERAYHRAAVVVWHRERYADVLLQAGVAAALPLLREQIELCPSKGAPSAAREQAVSLARRMVAVWAETPQYASSRRPSRPTDRAGMLKLLARLGDAVLVEEFIRNLVVQGYDGSENAALIASAPLLGPVRTGELLGELVSLQMPGRPGPCTDLLLGLISKHAGKGKGDWPNALRPIADAVIAGLDGIGADPSPRPFAYQPRMEQERLVNPGLIKKLLQTLGKLPGPDLRARAARRLSARPEVFEPVTILVPALHSLCAGMTGSKPPDSALVLLWAHSAEFLLARSEVPPEAPKDWRQQAKLSCACSECRELQAFVLDPVEQVHRFRVRQDRRNHLHSQIVCNGLEMDQMTDRHGSPQTLVCTKNRRNYRHRCEEYRKDIDALGLLATQAARFPAESASLLPRIEEARKRANQWTPA